MKNNENLEQIVPNVKVLNALRNSGYNNYTAIADIIDNSLENEVEAKNVYILLPNKKEPFDFIKICDDGCGMDYETLKDAITLGSQSTKNLSSDLGAYGTGLKSAAISIGQRLTIKTKTLSDEFLIAIFDIEELYEKNIWHWNWRKGSEEEYAEFKNETKSETGTIIEISKLDRLSNNNVIQFKDILKKKLGLIFRYFIAEKNKKISINDEPIIGLDPMHRDKDYSSRLSRLNETFKYNNKEYVFNFYCLNRAFKNEIDDTGWDGLNTSHQGLYIYRNLRLVGEALSLEMVPGRGDGHFTAMRIELFIDGEDDKLFASSFNKIITEKDQKDIDQGFRDSCKHELESYVREIKRRSDDYSNLIKEKKEEQKILDDIINGINKNKTLNIPKEKNEQDKKEEKEVDPRGPQQNPNKNKRKNDWLKGSLSSMGQYGKIFDVRIENGKHHIIINVDHIFYTEFFGNAPVETQKMFINWFSSSSVALQKLKYDPTDQYTIGDLLDNYHEELSSLMRKLIQY